MTTMTDAPPTIPADKVENTLRELMNAVLAEEDAHIATMIAEAFNLYLTTIRRRDGRGKLGPSDVRGILIILRVLMEVPTLEADLAIAYSQGKQNA